MLCCVESPGSATAGIQSAGFLQASAEHVRNGPSRYFGNSNPPLRACSCVIDDHKRSTATEAGMMAAAAQAVPAGTHTCCRHSALSGAMHAGSSSSSSYTMHPGPSLTTLPFEALACIAALLEQPDRHAFALTCTAAAQSVSTTTTSLVIPAPASAAWQQQQQQQQQLLCSKDGLRRYVGVQSLRITNCHVCNVQQQQQRQQHHQLLLSSSCCCPAPIASSIALQQRPTLEAGAAAAAAAMQWWPAAQHRQQQQQISADMAGCASGLMRRQHPAATAAAAATAAGGMQCNTFVQGLQQSRMQLTAAAAAAAGKWLHTVPALDQTLETSTTSSSSSSSSLLRMITAAGSSMPYLTSLDLSGVCLHSLRDPHTVSGGYTAAAVAAAAVTPRTRTTCRACSSNSSSLLSTICSACPNLAVLSLPDHLWQGIATYVDPPNLVTNIVGYNPAITPSPVKSNGTEGLVIPSNGVQLLKGQGLEFWRHSAQGSEGLTALTGLKKLRVLKLGSGPVPAGVLGELGLLTQVYSLSVCASSDVLLPAAASSSSSATVLGTALSNLKSLCKLVISGVTESGSCCLDQLSILPNLTQLDLRESSDLKVSSLGSISGLSTLRVLRIRRLRCLQAKSRASLPLSWQNLKQLAVMLLDFDLHLRDVQVLAGMPQLTLLGAASLHICVNPRFGLSMPNIRHLALHTLPLLSLAAVPIAAAAAAVPAAAAVQQVVEALQQQQQQQQQQVIQQQLLQQLMHLQQEMVWFPAQQQQQQQQQIMLLPQQPPVAAGMLNGHQQQQQQQRMYFVPAHVMLGAMPFAGAAAGGGGRAMYVVVNTDQQVQQQQQQQQTSLAAAAAAAGLLPAFSAAAAAAPAAVSDQGWLSQLCPNLDEMLVGVVDDNAFQAIKGHETLKRVVFGVSDSSSSSLGRRSAAAAAANPLAAAAAPLGWSVLPMSPNLESVKIINTDDVLSSSINLAVPYMGNCSSITLQKASSIGTLECWMISCYCKNLQLLAIEDSLVLTDVALQHLATLPNLRHLFLTGCPLVTAQGLHHLLMYCQHLESVSLYSCTAIHADVAEAVQQAVWRGTGRKVAVHWRAGRGDGRVDNHRRPNPSSRT